MDNWTCNATTFDPSKTILNKLSKIMTLTDDVLTHPKMHIDKMRLRLTSRMRPVRRKWPKVATIRQSTQRNSDRKHHQ